MGILRLLLRLPYYVIYIIWEASLYFILFLLVMLRAILWILSPLIGDIDWSIPKWYPTAKNIYHLAGAKIAKYKTVIGSIIIFSIAAYFTGNYAYHWYLNRPKPIDPAPIVINEYSIDYDSPAFSGDYLDTLDIYFKDHKRSPAPLELINKSFTEGVSISPAIEGEWTWYNDKTIRLKPTQPWPLGQSYTVTLDDEKLFAEHNKLNNSSKSFTFNTKDFSYSITDKEFYQDVTDPTNKLGIFTVSFSHPVDKMSFEKNISLKLYEYNPLPGKNETFVKNVDYTVTYDEADKKAYIKSTSLGGLPDVDSYLYVNIDKSVSSALGGTPTKTSVRTYVNVPNKYDLNIVNFDMSLVEVNNQEIRQILTVKLNHDVPVKDLAKVINVWQLPITDKAYTLEHLDKLSEEYKTRIEITDEVLANSNRLSLKLIETDERPNKKEISFEFKSNQNDEIYIQIDQPLISDGGYYLNHPYRNIRTVPMYPSILNFAANGSLLSLTGEKKLPIVYRNMSDVAVEIERVIPSQLQHLVSFSRNSDFQWMEFEYIDSSHFVEKYTMTKSLGGNPQFINYTDIDFSEYLKKDIDGNETRGIFLVRLYGNKNKGSDDFKYIESRFVMVTDMGIINKISLDQSQDIFVQSIHTGNPVSKAKVSLLGANGVEIISAQTGDDGHVHFAPFSEYYQGIKPLLFVVEKGQDLSFLPLKPRRDYYEYDYDRGLNFSRFDVGGLYESIDGGELRSHLFSDRGVYRPGDTFHVGTIVRAQNWSKSLAGIQLEVDIYNAKSDRVKTQSITLDNYGFNEISYKTDYTSPTGEWSINLYLKDANSHYRTLLGSTTIVIREFEPDKTAVSAKLIPEISEGWVHPSNLSAIVEAKNLFGTPAQNRLVKSQLFLQPSSPHFKKYDDYAFYQDRVSRGSFNAPIEDVKTDENGIANLTLPIESFDGHYMAKLLTDVFEPDSGRSVAATATVFVSPADYLVGGKPDGRLDYIKRDTTRSLNLIAINPKLEKIELDDLTLVKLEKKYLSELHMQKSGVYKYESRRKDVVVSETPFTINDNTVLNIDTTTPGNYILQLKDNDDQILYQTEYTIAGTANVTRSLDRNAELMLKIDNNQYKPGDEIEISITAPYVGSGIITIERDQVYAWKWFKTDTTSSVQKITLPEGVDGNAYINVQFIRDPSSDEVYMSPLTYGVIPFKIANDKFNDHIKLTAPERVKPGDTIPITIETNSKQRVVIFAVDEGILQVASYKLKNPLNQFIRKKALSVRTRQILDLILPQYSQLVNSSAPGGDAEELDEDALAANLNPFKRKVDEPVAYWSGIIDVDKTKTVNYTVPDYFNGKIRIMAISVGTETMGNTQTSTTVRNDIVLNPNIPYFVAPDDEFEISLSVANNLEEIGDNVIPINVTLTTTPQLTVLEDASKTIELAGMKEGTLRFKLKATSKLGSGDLLFTAKYQDKAIERKISTSVRPASQFRVYTTMGRMDGSKETFNNIRQIYEPFSKNEATVSYSPFVLSKGISVYLDNYPHYCSEQIISRAIPLLIGTKNADFGLITKNTIALDSLFQTLKSRQTSDGAVGLWYPTIYADPFISLYTVNFLLEAQDAGNVVPAEMLEKANNYIRQIASENVTGQYRLRLRAYAIYLLSRQGELTTNNLASIMENLNPKDKWWQTDITALYLASSYKMLQKDQEANKLLKPIWNELSDAYDNAWWSNNYYDPLVMNSAKIYLISKHFPDKARDIPPQALENLVLMLNKGRYTTQSSAMTLLAIDSYVSSINLAELKDDDLTITATNDKQETQVTIATLKKIIARGQFDPSVTTAITFNNATDLPAWYSLTQQGFDKEVQQEPIKRGLEIYREFTDAEGKIVEKVTQGDIVNVTVRIRTLSKEGATNIAVVDLLPGGFEVVQHKIKNDNDNYNSKGEFDGDDEDNFNDNGHHWISPIATGNYTWYPEYTEVREDRVIIYGSTESDSLQTFIYQIKATNVGEYVVPPAYGEAMYDREIQAVSKGGNKIIVESK